MYLSHSWVIVQSSGSRIWIHTGLNTDHLILLPLSPREWSFPGKAGICRWINLGDGTYLAEFSLQVLPPGDTAELQTVEQRGRVLQLAQVPVSTQSRTDFNSAPLVASFLASFCQLIFIENLPQARLLAHSDEENGAHDSKRDFSSMQRAWSRAT